MESREILDALGTGVLVLDPELKVLQANPAAQSLFVIGAGAAQGRSLLQLLPGATAFITSLERALRDGEASIHREVELRAPGVQGEAYVADISVTPLDGARPAQRLLLEIRDATQRRRMDREAALVAQLEGSRSMIRQLAHEIKNPLGGLRGAAQLLERRLADADTRDYTRLIINEADRLTALVDALLGPKGLLQKEQLNAHELCEHVLQLLRGEAPPGIVLERDYDPSLPELTVDRHMMVQALLNLGRNALQAISAQGRVTLRTRVLSHQSIGAVPHRLVAAIQVEDNGAGVPDAIRDTLFYPLVTGRAEGTGLGLAVAQDLAIRHGGLIEFDSQPGKTCFTLLLPVESDDVRHH